jgi:hypothetical protein
MKNWRITIFGLLLAGIWSNPGHTASAPSPLHGVSIPLQVSKDNATGILTYRYRVSNPATNDGQIKGIDIEISRGAGDVILSRDGLVNGPRYLRHSSEDAFQQVPMVPVGISGPEGWIVGLGFDSRNTRGFASWGSMDEPFRIFPGQTREGFQLTSYGLPGIRQVEIRPDVIPPEELGGWEELNAFYEQFTFHAKTVGPTAPPQNFVPIEFLNYLISLLHDSRQFGWIKVAGVHKSLLAKLLEAKRALEKGQTNVTKNTLTAFLNEVKAVSCQEFTCPGNKPLTSEAYALLFFNGQFLVDRLL